MATEFIADNGFTLQADIVALKTLRLIPLPRDI